MKASTLNSGGRTLRLVKAVLAAFSLRRRKDAVTSEWCAPFSDGVYMRLTASLSSALSQKVRKTFRTPQNPSKRPVYASFWLDVMA